VTIGSVCADLASERHARSVQDKTSIVFYVDDEGVHLGPLRHGDELGKLAPEGGPATDVETAKSIRRWYVRNDRPARISG
jgi:hypothetical protein